MKRNFIIVLVFIISLTLQAKDFTSNNKDYNKVSTTIVKLMDNTCFTSDIERYNHITSSVNAGFMKIGNTRSGDDNQVFVYLKLKNPASLPLLKNRFEKLQDYDIKSNLAVVWIGLNNLKSIISSDEVLSVKPVLKPVVNTGSALTEGDAIHNADDVRSVYGATGQNIKIGIISDGVNSRSTAQASGDLPADGSGLTVLDDTIGGDEGTAMLEIVHDIIPDADLYFHSCGNNTVAFNSAITDLVNAGCDVICDDIGWLTQPAFYDGTVAQHVETILNDNNVIYVSSAGNAGASHYQGQFYNDGSDYHDFSEGSVFNNDLRIGMSTNTSVRVVLHWNDEGGAADNDYDLFLFNSSDDVVASSEDAQNGSGNPVEFLSFDTDGSNNGTYKIRVLNYSASGNEELEVFIYGNSGVSIYGDNISPVDAVYGHPAVENAVAVGAIRASEPGNDDIEYFSSQGPVTFSTIPGVSTTRTKPDICGIDGVAVTGAGGFPNPFYGTSASAPHVAALMGQLWSAKPELTGDEVRDEFYLSAVDLGNAGFDYVYGNGRADSYNAFSANQPPAPALVSTNNVNQTDFTLTWSSVGIADSYEVDIASDGNFTSYVSSYQNYSVSSTSLLVNSGLSAGTDYYVRVRSVDGLIFGDNSHILVVHTSENANNSSGEVTVSANQSDGSDALSITFAAESVSSSNPGQVSITVRENTMPDNIPLEHAGRVVRRGVDIVPQNDAGNGNFDCSIVFHYTDEEISGLTENDLVLYNYYGGAWHYVGGAVNAAENTITVNGVSHLSEWVAFDSDGGSQTLPVEMSSFTGTFSGESVLLTWVTASESDMLGYYVYKSENMDLVNSEQINTEIIQARNLSYNSEYSFRDEFPGENDEYFYWVESISMDNNSKFYGPTRVIRKITEDMENYSVKETELYNVLPNPFNPTTEIMFDIAGESTDLVDTRVEVYNIKGQKIKTLLDEKINPTHKFTIQWNGEDETGKHCSSGTYFIILETDNFKNTKKAVLLK